MKLPFSIHGIVIPAKAGIHWKIVSFHMVMMDPRFCGDDTRGVQNKTSSCPMTIALFYFFTFPLFAQPSLLFTEKELQLIHQNIPPKNEREETAKYSEELYLSAIIYVDDSHWSIWLNNRVIHATDSRLIDGFHIKKVTLYTVEFSWTPPNSGLPTSFTLRPHQKYFPRENRVIPQ